MVRNRACSGKVHFFFLKKTKPKSNIQKNGWAFQLKVTQGIVVIIIVTHCRLLLKLTIYFRRCSCGAQDVSAPGNFKTISEADDL